MANGRVSVGISYDEMFRIEEYFRVKWGNGESIVAKFGPRVAISGGGMDKVEDAAKDLLEELRRK